jgi:hypothetical protein
MGFNSAFIGLNYHVTVVSNYFFITNLHNKAFLFSADVTEFFTLGGVLC